MNQTVIIGASIAGLSLARRLAERGVQDIVILEKRDAPQDELYFYSEAFIQYLNQIYNLHPARADLIQDLALEKVSGLPFLAGGKERTIDLGALLSEKNFKEIGGLAVKKEAQKAFDYLQQEHDKDLKLSQGLQLKRSSPFLLSLEKLGFFLGFTEAASLSVYFLKDKLTAGHFFYGSLLAWKTELMRELEDDFGVEIHSDCYASNISGSPDGGWLVQSRVGRLAAKHLVVTSNPWESASWIPRGSFPERLLKLHLKAKPASAVSYEVKMERAFTDVPAYGYLASEDAFFSQHDGQCQLRCLIDFETSLQATSVTKAIKRLKRAYKKICLTSEEDVIPVLSQHIALRSCAVAQPATFADSQIQQKIKKEDLMGRQLFFCGKAYGPYFDDISNIKFSVDTVLSKVAGADGSKAQPKRQNDDLQNALE